MRSSLLGVPRYVQDRPLAHNPQQHAQGVRELVRRGKVRPQHVSTIRAALPLLQWHQAGSAPPETHMNGRRSLFLLGTTQ